MPISLPKWALPAAAAIAFLGLAAILVVAVSRWQASVHQSGYDSGFQAARAEAEAAARASAEAALERARERVQRGEEAVQGYIQAAAQAAARSMRGEIARYAQGTGGALVCLDADGVRLLRELRAARGQGAHPAASGDARGAVQPPAPPARDR